MRISVKTVDKNINQRYSFYKFPNQIIVYKKDWRRVGKNWCHNDVMMIIPRRLDSQLSKSNRLSDSDSNTEKTKILLDYVATSYLVAAASSYIQYSFVLSFLYRLEIQSTTLSFPAAINNTVAIGYGGDTVRNVVRCQWWILFWYVLSRKETHSHQY